MSWSVNGRPPPIKLGGAGFRRDMRGRGAGGRFAEREDAMRTILCALCAAAILGLAAPVHAQNINLLGGGSMKPKTQDDVDAEAARNRDYQNTIKKLPDQNAKRDPWGSMRNNSADADQKKKRAGAQ